MFMALENRITQTFVYMLSTLKEGNEAAKSKKKSKYKTKYH